MLLVFAVGYHRKFQPVELYNTSGGNTINMLIQLFLCCTNAFNNNEASVNNQGSPVLLMFTGRHFHDVLASSLNRNNPEAYTKPISVFLYKTVMLQTNYNGFRFTDHNY